MLKNLALNQVLFLDVETVPLHENHESLSDIEKKLWKKKADILSKNPEKDTPESLYQRAGIYAEFGKIICISTGHFVEGSNKRAFRLRSFYGDDEKQLLIAFCDYLNRNHPAKTTLLCAHNGKEFDFPYISRRLLINGLPLPAHLDLAGKKPWEVNHIDTMELWKFGDYKSFTSLELLAHVFSIPTPKDDIDGSKVYEVYYKEKNLPRIVDYCGKDVITLLQLMLRWKNMPLLNEEEIVHI
jgi:3'-5' exonuclease